MAIDDAAQKEAKRRIVRGLKGEGAHLSLADAVGGFPESLMNTSPEYVPYTFWHQLEHIRICQWDILRYVVDPAHVSPKWPHGYWPEATATADLAGWNHTIESYQLDAQAFVDLVENPATDVLVPVEHNAGRSVLGSALVAIDHNSYHLGEFVMGRQMLGEWKSLL